MAGNKYIKSSENPRKAKFSLGIDLLGYAFYGRKNVNKKDGSYTATQWLVLGFLPLWAEDTYRIKTPRQNSFFPRIFRRGEYIPYQKVKVNFDSTQTVITLLAFWLPFFAGIFFLFINPIIVLEAGLLGVTTYSTYQLIKRPRKAKVEVPAVVGGHELQKDKTTSNNNAEHITMPKLVKPEPKKAQPKPKPTPPPPKPVPPPPPVVKAPYLTIAEMQAKARLNPIQIKERKSYRLIFLGFITLFTVLGYIYFYAYFANIPEISANMVLVYRIFVILSTYKLLAVITFNLGVIIALFRSKVLGLTLIILSAALLLNLHRIFWEYIYNCCLDRPYW